VSNDLLSFTRDGNIRRETWQLISQAQTYSVQLQELQKAKQAAESELGAAKISKKRAEEILTETASFITIGVGVGISYAIYGLNVSIYMHPNGLILTGAYGYAGSWNIGGGYSLGSRKSNWHIKFLYGRDSEKTPVGYIGCGGNFDIISRFGLNVDLGIGGDLDANESSFLGSVGIYVKF
jgi:outer membrane murein-binding lipoprotein Lpp